MKLILTRCILFHVTNCVNRVHLFSAFVGHPSFHDDLLETDSKEEAEPRVGRVHGGRPDLRRVQGGHGPAQHDDEADRPDERRLLAPEQQHAQPEAERDLEP